MLLELVNSGKVAFEADGRKLAGRGPAPFTNELLQESLTRINKPMKPQRAVEKLRNHVKDNVIAQLDARGASLKVGRRQGSRDLPVEDVRAHRFRRCSATPACWWATSHKDIGRRTSAPEH